MSAGGGPSLQFIDTHCHIVPGVDDGASSPDVSLRMARIAVADGIGRIIATSHIVEGYYDGSDLEKRLEALRRLFAEDDVGLELIAGAEVPMSICMAGEKQVLADLTLADGKYLLMETADTTYDQVARAAYHVRLCGFLPILAHPERTLFVQKDLGKLKELLANSDVFCQITASSLEGLFGKGIQKTSYSMLKAGVVHLVASDAHSAGRRKPVLSESKNLLVKAVGEENAAVIMYENPARILAGDDLLQKPAISRQEVSKRSFLARFMGK